MAPDHARIFGLTARAFEPVPDPRFHFSSLSQRKAVSAVSYALNRGAGIAVLTGADGLGKTSLLANMTEQISGQPVTLASLAGKGDAFVSRIAQAFGLSPSDDESHTLSAIEAFLVEEMRRGQRALLLVDDAEDLPDGCATPLASLAELKHGERSLVQIILAGNEDFAARLSEEEWSRVHGQTVASNSFEPLQANEVEPYLRHRLLRADWTGRPALDPGLAPLLHEATGGVPAAINRVMSMLLDRAAANEADEIDGDALASWLDTDPDDVAAGPQPETETEPNSATSPALAEAQIAAIEHAFAQHDRMLIKLRRDVAELREHPVAEPREELARDFDHRFEAIETRLDQHEQALRQMLERLIDFFERSGSGPR